MPGDCDVLVYCAILYINIFIQKNIYIHRRYLNALLQWVLVSLQNMKNTCGWSFTFTFYFIWSFVTSSKSQNTPLHILILGKVIIVSSTMPRNASFRITKIFLCIVSHLHAIFSWSRSTCRTKKHKWVSRSTCSTFVLVNCTNFWFWINKTSRRVRSIVGLM